MVKKITAFTHHENSLGHNLPFTYSVIDDNGNLVKENARANTIVAGQNVEEEKVIEAIKTITDYIKQKIPE